MDPSGCGRDGKKDFALRIVGIVARRGARLPAFDGRFTWLPGLQIRKDRGDSGSALEVGPIVQYQFDYKFVVFDQDSGR